MATTFKRVPLRQMIWRWLAWSLFLLAWTLALSDLAREMARAAGSDWVLGKDILEEYSLEEKSRQMLGLVNPDDTLSVDPSDTLVISIAAHGEPARRLSPARVRSSS